MSCVFASSQTQLTERNGGCTQNTLPGACTSHVFSWAHDCAIKLCPRKSHSRSHAQSYSVFDVFTQHQVCSFTNTTLVTQWLIIKGLNDISEPNKKLVQQPRRARSLESGRMADSAPNTKPSIPTRRSVWVCEIYFLRESLHWPSHTSFLAMNVHRNVQYTVHAVKLSPSSTKSCPWMATRKTCIMAVNACFKQHCVVCCTLTMCFVVLGLNCTGEKRPLPCTSPTAAPRAVCACVPHV